MDAPLPNEALAESFEAQRGRLLGVAYRGLGSHADAEDAVQEAWLRFARQDTATIDNLGGWLTTVVGRICIDALRSRQAKREVAFEPLLPLLEIREDAAPAADEDAELADSVGLALLVVLETLGPAERLAFVLHDMFAVSYEEIGLILGRSSGATKMLASRARRKVRGNGPHDDARHPGRAVVDAFLAAARDGDFQGLLGVLHPEVAWRTHTPRGVTVTLGATDVATAAVRGGRARGIAHPVVVNGHAGIVAWAESGRALGVMACTVAEGRIVEINSFLDRERLAAMDLPGRPSSA
jgi:RNA polymerase sigma factor (sigma-70 family)